MVMKRSFILSLCIIIPLYYFILIKVNQIVETPYIDEIFHVKQTKTYCKHDFKTWDPKITTLPGLYIISFLVTSFLDLFTNETTCTLSVMRSISTFFGIINYILIYLHLTLGKRIMRIKDSIKVIILSIVISSFPLIFFYNFIYYTDSVSLTFVLLMFYLQRLRYNSIAPIIGTITIVIRQTNVIWVVFSYFMEVLNFIRKAKLKEISKSKEKSQKSLDFFSAIRLIFDSLRIIITNLYDFIIISIGYIATILSFAVFVYLNGDITVGDKSAHKPFFHFPQIIYFVGSFGLSFFPLLLEYNIRNKAYIYHIFKLIKLEENILSIPILKRYKLLRKFINLFISSSIIILTLFCIYKFTYAHPYLLSDNRHYTFYLWRLYIKYGFIKYASIIPFHFIIYSIFHIIIYSDSNQGMIPITCNDDQSKAYKSFGHQIRLIWLNGTFILICSVIIPSPLLEPRYFVIPYVILAIAIINSTEFSFSIILTGFIYVLINIITIYIFLYKPYSWPNEYEPIARFMW